MCGVDGGRELGWGRARFCLLLLNELESSMLSVVAVSVKSGSKWWGAEVQPTA